MNKLIALLFAGGISLGMSLVSTAQADGASCTASCTVDHNRCTALPGASADGNCGDGYRLCVQRCDPRRMNSSFLESDAVKRSLLQRVASNGAQHCASNCAQSAQACVEVGNGRGNCHNTQVACESRCNAG